VALLADGSPDLHHVDPVAPIEQQDGSVTVTAMGGETFTAPAVVVAVPLNTLSAIDFSPALPEAAAAAADRGQAGRGIKLSVHARGGGDVEPMFRMAPNDHPITFLETQRVLPDGSHVLVAFGPDAERLRRGDEGAVRRAFDDMLPEALEVVEVVGHDWLADPYSRGTWSVYRPGQLSGSLAALRAPHGRVLALISITNERSILSSWTGRRLR
jgi:monoamine oxidase